MNDLFILKRMLSVINYSDLKSLSVSVFLCHRMSDVC